MQGDCRQQHHRDALGGCRLCGVEEPSEGPAGVTSLHGNEPTRPLDPFLITAMNTLRTPPHCGECEWSPIPEMRRGVSECRRGPGDTACAEATGSTGHCPQWAASHDRDSTLPHRPRVLPAAFEHSIHGTLPPVHPMSGRATPSIRGHIQLLQ